MILKKLSDRVECLLGLNPGFMTLEGTNCYLVGKTSKKVMIDCSDGNLDFYQQLLEWKNETKCTIETLLITHWHHDHIGGYQQVRSLFPSVVLKKFPYNETDFLPIKDQEIIKIDDETHLKAFHLPGHTEDHICFWLKEENSWFTGDLILGGQQPAVAFEDFDQYMQSLSLMKRPNLKRIYPGHGQVIENGNERIEMYIQHRLKRHEQIFGLLPREEFLSEQELVEKIYSGSLPKEVLIRAQHQLHLHLESMKKENKVTNQLNNGDQLWKLS